MLKRLFWLLVGMAIGFATSFRVYRAVRQTLGRYAPDHVAADVSRAARSLRRHVATALAEGAEAMRKAEAELRAELGQL